MIVKFMFFTKIIPLDTLMDKLKQLEHSKTQQKERIAELEKNIKNINIDEKTYLSAKIF